jgi:DNA polymerase-3 subunit alpha
MVAILNNGGGFYRPEHYVHEARMQGAGIHAPDVNKSEVLCTIYGQEIYLGFAFIKDLEAKVSAQIAAERSRGGAFTSLHEFMKRIEISAEQLQLLIQINAFRFTGRTKKQLHWDVVSIMGANKKTDTEKELFETERKNYKLPPLYESWIDDAWDEIELLGFPLCSPFKMMRPVAATGSVVLIDKAADFKKHKGHVISIVGYWITYKGTRTKHGEAMMFGTFIDKEGAFFDTTHFPKIAAAYPFNFRGCYLVTGRVAEDFDFYSIDVTEMKFLESYTKHDDKIPEIEAR